MKRFWRLGLIPALVATLALSACERENADTVATSLAESNQNAQMTAVAMGTPMAPSGEVTPGAEGEGGIAVQPEAPASTPGAEGYPGAVATPGPEETTVAVPGAEGEPPPATEGQPPATEGEAGTTDQPAAPPAEGTTTYVVKAGDSLFTIASALGTTIEQLRALNPALQASDLIFVGQELIVPAAPGAAAPPAEGQPPAEPGQPRVHVVQQGEWVYQIARDYGVTPQAIFAANPGVDLSVVYPGQEIIIP